MKITDIELNEKLVKVEDDVERLYQNYFSDLIDAIKTKDKNIISNAFNKSMVSRTTEQLIEEGTIQNNTLIQLHFDNPLTIYFNVLGENAYNSVEGQMALNINVDALTVLINDLNGDIGNSWLLGDTERMFLIEFTPEKMKSSIHHEIAHWHDDTKNNRHLLKSINKAKETGNAKKYFRKNEPDINLTKVELEAQIHNIYQLYLNNKDKWDELKFDDLLEMLPALTALRSIMKNLNQFDRWKKMLLKRMAREGILGKNMSKQ